MQFNMVVKRDDKDSWYAYNPAVPGCVSIAETREKVLETIKEAIQGFFETEEKGRMEEFLEEERIAVNI